MTTKYFIIIHWRTGRLTATAQQPSPEYATKEAQRILAQNPSADWASVVSEKFFYRR